MAKGTSKPKRTRSKPKSNIRGAGSVAHKELRDRLRHKGDSRRGDGSRADIVGQTGGGP